MLLESNYFTTSLIKKIFLGTFILLSFTFFSCNQSSKSGIKEFECSVENNSGDTILVDDNAKNIYFKGIDLLSDSISKSGEYSLKLDSKRQFGFGTKLVLKTNFMYELSFWQYGENDKVFAVIQSDSTLYKKSSTVVEVESSDWQKISLTFTVPDKYENKEISLYIWNVSKKNVFIDDFHLIRY
jgi:Carbohydrate binding domain